jgi:hypothetical protein
MNAKHHIKTIIAAFTVLSCLTLQAQDQKLSEEHAVSPFKTLIITGSSEVVLTQGHPLSLRVEGNETDLNSVKISRTKDDALRVASKGGNTAVTYIITPELNAITLQDASKLKGSGQFVTDTFTLEAKGASSAAMNLVAEHLTLELAGASTANLHGSVSQLTLKTGGASQARLDSLVAHRGTVTSTGASFSKLHITEVADGRVSGVASVVMVTEPETNNIAVTSVAAAAGEVMTETITMDGSDEEIQINEFINEVEKARKTKKKKFNGHFKGLELGVNTFMMPDQSLSLSGDAELFSLNIPSSFVWNLNLFEANLPLIAQQFGLVTGAGFEFNSYHFEEDVFLIKEDGVTKAVLTDKELEFKKNKLSATYLKVPFLLEFQTNSGSKKNSFHIAGGVNFGLRLGSSTKQKYFEDGTKVKEKIKDRYHLNPYRMAAIGKIGWGKLNFFAEYNLMPLFEKNRGPELYAVSVGITLMNWN